MRATTITTSDKDQAQMILDEHFYSNVVDLLAPTPRWQARFDVRPAGSVTIGDLRFGTDVRVRFGELGAYHVDVPLSGRLRWRQGGSESSLATVRSAAVFQPVGDTTLERWSGDCRLLAVKINSAVLENQLAGMVDAPVTSPIRLGPQLDITRGAGASWVRLLRMLTADAGQPDGLALHPVLGEYLQESLVAGLLLAGDHQYRHLLDEPVAVAAPGAIRRAVEAMRAEPGRSFTVATLADIAGISSRSLQHGFRRYLGVSPMAYLRSLRLAAAHDELRLADAAQVTVSQIAYRYGFLHLGRFAAVYRARYGVSPAQTLRR